MSGSRKLDPEALPASEAGTGMIPEDRREEADTSLPESEAGSPLLEGEDGAEPQSWPGKSFGSIPPPG